MHKMELDEKSLHGRVALEKERLDRLQEVKDLTNAADAAAQERAAAE